MPAERADAELLSLIRQPVLPMAGACSPPPVHRGIARVAPMLPHAQTTTIHGADHPPPGCETQPLSASSPPHPLGSTAGQDPGHPCQGGMTPEVQEE